MKKSLSQLLVVIASIVLALSNEAPRELILKRTHEGNLEVISIIMKFTRQSERESSQMLRWGRSE